MHTEIWKPSKTNEALYNQWKEVFYNYYTDGYNFDNFVVRNPKALEHFLVLAHSDTREAYYNVWRRQRKCSFDNEIFERFVIDPGKSYGAYRLKANTNPFVEGAMLSVHREKVSMDDMDEPATRENFRTWSEMARDLGVIVVKNYGDNGASITNQEHAHVFAVEVPLNYFLQRVDGEKIVGYPGKNLVCHHRDIDRVVAQIFELCGSGVSPNPFMYGDRVGYLERQLSDEADDFFGARPSGVTLLGMGEAGTRERFEQLKMIPFEEIWKHHILALNKN